MPRLYEKTRSSIVRTLRRAGWDERARALMARVAVSPRVRRDERDMRNMDLIIAAYVRPTDVCVDIGANVGTVSAMLVRVAPESQHILIEALPDLADRLRARFPSCEVHAVAVSDHEGHDSFVRVIDRPTRSGLHPNNVGRDMRTERIDVVVSTLDSLLAGRKPRLVKIDVEGSELEVLRGAQTTLIDAAPVLIFEHQPGPDELEDTRALHALLTKFGYRIFDIDGRGPLSKDAMVATCARAKLWTFLGVASA